MNQPLVQAEILRTVGDAYLGVGEAATALPFLTRSVELFGLGLDLGPDHPETLTSMNNLGWGYSKAGQLEKALPLLEETLKLKQAYLGPDHPDTLNRHDGYLYWVSHRIPLRIVCGCKTDRSCMQSCFQHNLTPRPLLAMEKFTSSRAAQKLRVGSET